MNRRSLRKAASAAAVVFSSAFLVQIFSGVSVPVSAESVMTTAEIAENMGIGWNLGNSLDANNQGYYSGNIYDYETQWSNPVVTQSLINKVKAKGFNTIRIPVTWYQHISSDGSYTIDSAWMARVKEVVDYAYNNGMYVILNIHHETWINRSDFESAEASMEAELRAVWKQIAEEFADYGQRLIFEGMNEPREVGGSADEWVGNEACYNVVNQLNSAFVDTVRSVESPYRQTRMLMVPDYAASRESYIYSYLTIPKASGSIDADNDGDDDYVAVSLHAYSPFGFAMGDDNHATFTSSYEAELEDMFSTMQSHFLQEGVQIVLGEFSASNYGYDDARLAWAECYMKNATEYGIPCVLWDNNVESNNGGEAHGYINRSTETWYYSGGLVVDKLISTRNSTSWGTKSYITYPMYAHKDFSNGSDVTIDTGSGNIYVSNLSGFESGTELAVKYSGTSLPVGALMTTGWGGWTTINPYDYDKDNKVAYFSYDQIMKTWNTSNGELGVIQIKDIGTIGFVGVKLLTVSGDVFKISKQPLSVLTAEGKTASFSISASGGTLTYQWQSSSDGTVWTDISGAASSVLSVTASMDMNGKMFRCVVSDGTETLISDVVILSVREAGSKYSHNDYSSGTSVTIADDGVVKLYETSGFGTGKEFAIKFDGVTIPEIALMDMAWDGWTELVPYDIDTYYNIAYVSYDQIMEAWGTDKGTLAHVKVYNKSDIGFGGITLLDIPQQQTDFKITTDPSDSSLYYCEQLTLTAAASTEKAEHTWYISRDNGISWAEAYTASEDVTSDSGITTVKSIFDLYKNNIGDLDTVLFRCDFSDGNTTKSTAGAKVTVLSRNPAVTVGTVKYNSAEISWQANPYAVSYKVYRVENGGFVRMESCTGTKCTLTGLSEETEYEIFVSAVYSDGADVPYNDNSVKFTTAEKTVDDMTIEECIELVNSIGSDEDAFVLTEEQLRAIERVIEYDYGK